MGVTVDLDGPDMVLSPASEVPTNLIPVLKEHKPEIIAYIQQRTHPASFPWEGTVHGELADIERSVNEHGVCLLWAEVLDDRVAFYRSEEDRAKIPPGFVPYSAAELWTLGVDAGTPIPGV